MNIVLFELYGINGALIDAIEYYLYMKSINKDVKLCLIRTQYSTKKESIYSLIDDRYDIPFDYKKGIIYYNSRSELLRQEFTNVLILDYTTVEHAPIIRAEHIHIIYDHHKSKRRIYNVLQGHDHITVYNEMPFGIGVPYKMKFAFDLYRIPDRSQRRCYVNCANKSYSELSRVELYTDKEIMITGYDGVTDSAVIAHKSHPKDFFSLFDTYAYIHDGKYFEPRCRLLMECFYLDKHIIYDNEYDIKDGSYYRYEELLEKGVSERHFTPEDQIVKEF